MSVTDYKDNRFENMTFYFTKRILFNFSYKRRFYVSA